MSEINEIKKDLPLMKDQKINSIFDDLGFSDEHEFKNMKTCVAQCKGIVPRKYITECRDRGVDVLRLNGQVKWGILREWLNEHKKDLSAGVKAQDNISLEAVKIQLGMKDLELKDKDLVLRDLDIEKKRGQMVDPEEVSKFMGSFGILLSSVLKKKKGELISKCTGYEKVIEGDFNEIFEMIKGMEFKS